jgi:hypothetical protein
MNLPTAKGCTKLLPNKPRGVAWLNDHRGPQRHQGPGLSQC